jgi:hypothetical protein
MRRRVYNWLTLVSLLLAVTVAGLWVRSAWWATDFFWVGPPRKEMSLIASEFGRIRISNCSGVTWDGWFGHGYLPARNRTVWALPFWAVWPAGVYPPPQGFISFTPAMSAPPARPPTRHSFLSMPDWLLLVVFLAFPAWWGFWRYRKRPRPNSCRRCGYDLRGTIPTGGTECPECGEPIPAAKPAATEAKP